MNKHYDDIEDYLNGELRGADLQAFEQAMQADPALREAVDRHRALIEQLRGMRLRQTVKKNMQPPPARYALNPRVLAFAAAFLLLLAALYFWMPKPPEPAPMAPVTPTPGPVEQTIEQGKPDIAQRPAPVEAPLPAGEHPGAGPKTRQACADVLRNMHAPDYTVMGDAVKDAGLEKQLDKAITLLKVEQPLRAIPLLDAVLASGNALYREDAEWLLAIAWLLSEPAKGREQLDAIAQNPAHAWRTEALRLAGRLE
jgi:hypothetical protein